MDNKKTPLTGVAPGSTCFVIESQSCDRTEYEGQIDGLPDADRELAKAVTTCADLCRYFSEKRMQVPPHIIREMKKSSTVPSAERLEKFCQINSELMEYLHSVGKDSEFRM
jgi:hypothetical protein